jgi:hypothetical protein
MEKKVIKSLQKRIHTQTHQLIAKYKELAAHLKSIESNDALTNYIRFLQDTIHYYERQYVDYLKLDLANCKAQQEPVLGLNKIEQAFDTAEQGFYELYPDKAFEQHIKKLFKKTVPIYEKLNAYLARIH